MSERTKEIGGAKCAKKEIIRGRGDEAKKKRMERERGKKRASSSLQFKSFHSLNRDETDIFSPLNFLHLSIYPLVFSNTVRKELNERENYWNELTKERK